MNNKLWNKNKHLINKFKIKQLKIKWKQIICKIKTKRNYMQL